MAIPPESRVYELSSRGALFRHLRHRFRDFHFSEYFDDVQPGDERDGIPCQDVQNLRIPDDTFDLVTSTEVFEHVPNDGEGFSEIHRVLKPGGWFVFTVPFTGNPVTVERAYRLPDGEVRHLLPPEYHSDRIRGSSKVLTYRNYGRDILERLGNAGFIPTIQSVESKRFMIAQQEVVIGKKRHPHLHDADLDFKKAPKMI